MCTIRTVGFPGAGASSSLTGIQPTPWTLARVRGKRIVGFRGLGGFHGHEIGRTA